MFKITQKFALAVGVVALLLAMAALYHVLFPAERLAAAGKNISEAEYSGQDGTIPAESENAENVESTENAESTENTEDVENNEDVGSTEDIKSSEDIESTDGFESIENAENIERTKTLYLTFDDGPSDINTPRVLDILKKRNIKATFFLVGKYVELHPEIVKRIAEEGHTIGIHSYSHNYGLIYSSVEAFVADFERAHQAVYDAAGVDSRIFRFPGGSINTFNAGTRASIIKEMTDRGYNYFDWNASFQDAAVGITPEIIFENAMRTVGRAENPVMLAHDVVPATVEILETLLDSLPEYEVKPITDDVAPVHF